MSIEYTSFGGWKDNLRLVNDAVELIVPLEIGPRVLSFRPLDGANVFKVVRDQLGQSGEKDWKIRGGHRLWLAPEDFDRVAKQQSLTYLIDNSAIEHRVEGERALRIMQTVETPARIRRELVIQLEAESPRVTVEHLITNEGEQPLEFAPWALSVMAEGGYAVIPRPPLGEHPRDFLPNQTIIVWPFTDLHDERLRLGRRVTKLAQTGRRPLKFGLRHTGKWAGYVLGTQLFLKTIPWVEGETYPDFGCNFETFTNADFLELESLGPYKRVAPGETLRHTETWAVFNHVRLPDIQDEEEFLGALDPYVKKLL